MTARLLRWDATLARLFTGRWGLAAVLALTLALALPGFFTLPPVDRDEVLFSQASAQMLASGDLVDIRFADQPRYKKPVGIYWLQAAAAALTGHPEAIWSFRLVSLAGAMAAVGLTFAIARRLMPPDRATLAALMLAACLILGAEARLAKTDAMLLATVLMGQWVLARAVLPGGKSQTPEVSTLGFWAFWVGLAASILIKGPIGLMVTGFTIAGLCLYRRDLALIRALRPLRGGALLLALVLPWFIAITLKSEGGFWAASVSRDLIAKLGEGQESHGAPPGSYLAALWLTFWPGSMLLLPALPRIWTARRQPVTLFMAAWVVPVWIIFELTSTKLLHYVMPTYPALAILTALALPQAGRWRWSALLPAMVAPALLIGLTLAAQGYDLTLPATVWPLGAALILSTLALLWLILRLPQATGLLTLSLAAAGLSAALVIYPTLASMTPLWPARSLAALADDHPGCQLTVAGYGEPSLIFLTQRRVALAPAEAIAAAFAAPGCQIVALPVTAPQPSGQSLGTLSALNLGTGKRIQLALYIKAE